MKKIWLYTLCILLTNSGVGQIKRASQWFLGWKAGIDFSSGNPISSTVSQMASIEGSSCIADTSGSLLFYSNGESVWNKLHQPMSNGSGLMGDQSAAQSSLIVPLPESDSLYYLFTTAALAGYGARYNIIDMSLDGDLGAITQKNSLLFSNGTEEMAGTQHCNAKDYWVVLRENVANEFRFRAYRLTKNGLDAPVISSFTITNTTNNTVGGLTFSLNGSKLIFNSFSSDLYIFNFNIESGLLTLQNTIPREANQNIYSTALSPDATKLYVSIWTASDKCRVVQYDITAPDINFTRTVIDSIDFQFGSPNGYGFFGQLRLAPDQKIYVSRWNQTYPFQINPETYYSLDSLDAILLPNMTGIACLPQRNYLYLNHRPTMLGLPNFISNFLNPVLPSYSCYISLPVILSNISAVPAVGQVKISWMTAQEINTSHFILERSTDGTNFNRVTIMNAAGFSNSPNSYSYIDHSPADGLNFYRVKIVDIDGHASISKIVFAKNNIAPFVVYPNPAKERIHVLLKKSNNPVYLILYSLSGRQVLKTIIIQAGVTSATFNTERLQNGVYVIKVVSEGTMFLKTIVKQ